MGHLEKSSYWQGNRMPVKKKVAKKKKPLQKISASVKKRGTAGKFSAY